MLERDWSRPLGLELIEEPIKQLPLILRHFSGKPVKTMEDHERLEKSYKRIFRIMFDGKWRTVDEIQQLTGLLHTSISAHLRNFRKFGFGAHTVNPRERDRRLYEFQVIPNPDSADTKELLREEETRSHLYESARANEKRSKGRDRRNRCRM